MNFSHLMFAILSFSFFNLSLAALECSTQTVVGSNHQTTPIVLCGGTTSSSSSHTSDKSTKNDPGSTNTEKASSMIDTKSRSDKSTKTQIASNKTGTTLVKKPSSSNTSNPTTGNNSPTKKSPLTTTNKPHSEKLSTADKTTTSPGVAIIFPVTTSVAKPTAINGHAVIPCNSWFFSLCLPGIDLFGWGINKPPGIHPPGPPPPLETKNNHLTISTKGKLPNWPKYTIGPDHIPTFSPTSKPDDCTPETAELCIATTSFKTSVLKRAIVTISAHSTTTCGTVTGCHIEGTSTTTTKTTGVCATETANPSCLPKTLPYVVYPSDSEDTKQVMSIETELKNYVKDETKIYASNKKWKNVVYWVLPLTDANATTLRNFPNVATVDIQCNDICDGPGPCIPCPDPSITIEYQPPVTYEGDESKQLGFVSWPPGQASYSNYYFDDSGGKAIPVYILDSGANLDNPEFQNTNLWDKEDLKWIWVEDDFDGRRPKDDANTAVDPTLKTSNAHGTQMLSLVAGNLLGVAKRVKPILVRMPRRSPEGAGWSKEDWLKGLQAINDDLGAVSDGGLSGIVLMAQCFQKENMRRLNDKSEEQYVGGELVTDSFGFTSQARALLKTMESKGALMVTGGGNDPAIIKVNGWPQTFAVESPVLESLLVAGAISLDGQTTKYAQSPEHGVPHVFAPGINILVANGQPVDLAQGLEANKYRRASGTSMSAAYTAGLAAYFWKLEVLGRARKTLSGKNLELTAIDLKKYIIDWAWMKTTVNEPIKRPKSIWNTLTIANQKDTCQWNPKKPIELRRDTGHEACTPPSTEPQHHCYDERFFNDHGDIHKTKQEEFAIDFCLAVHKAGDTVYSPAKNPTKKQGYIQSYTHDATVYTYRLRWEDGCDQEALKQNASYPLGKSSRDCSQIMFDNYSKCTGNGGVGGFTKAGCLRYAFVGGSDSVPPCDNCATPSPFHITSILPTQTILPPATGPGGRIVS